ncbi:fluoride efflux transporter FluC [Prochlorococcus marinus]|uniref:fluoride efflux transporter FluC n=1 Tax=Prochlorococcus marinus TaxID=1219 RepID=UPI000515A3BB|nr:CrcB family protein [Prochlorococcus marinus]
MDFSSIGIVLLGSTFGLILRIFIQDNFTIKIGFDIQNTSLVNFIASFLLGILVPLNFFSNYFLLFYAGFLGSFSTFSSFIYQLFILFKKRRYLSLIFHYTEVMIISFILFYFGYFISRIFK